MEQEYNDEKLRVAGIVEESIVDGPGIRFVIFVQGCFHRCEGCHNSHTQDFNGGEDMGIDEILNKISDNPLLDGVTFSGGEPFEQSYLLSKLASRLKKLNYNIIAYSGYTYEEIKEKSKRDISFSKLIQNIDILIDGKFENSKKNLKLKFRGSENQRIIDVKKTITSEKIVITDL